MPDLGVAPALSLSRIAVPSVLAFACLPTSRSRRNSAAAILKVRSRFHRSRCPSVTVNALSEGTGFSAFGDSK